MFTTDTDRRGIEFQLTEAVHREIQNRTHLRLARPPHADTLLTGRLVQVQKLPLGVTEFFDPREIQLTFLVEVTWQDLRSGQILAQHQVPVSPDVVHVQAESEFAPEVGQSLATALHEGVERVARQIVDMMEVPW
jgi:hypothetical protein